MRALTLLFLALPATAGAAARLTVAADAGFDQRPELRLAEPGPDDQADPSAIGRLMLGGLVPLLHGSAGTLDLRPAGELLGARGEGFLVITRAEAVLDAATAGERPALQLSLGGRGVKVAPEADASYLRGSADGRAVATFGPAELGLGGYMRTRAYADRPSWNFRSLAFGPLVRVGDEDLSAELSFRLQGNRGAAGVGGMPEPRLEPGGRQQIVDLAVGYSPASSLELRAAYNLRLAHEREGERAGHPPERELERGRFREPPAFGPGGEPDEDADEVSAGGFVRHGLFLDATWLATEELSLDVVGEVGRKLYRRLIGVNREPRQDTIYAVSAVGRYGLTPELSLTLSAAVRGDHSNDEPHTFQAASASAGFELRF